MEVLKKSIILSPASCDGISEEKGILTLQKELGKIKGTLKCFHLNDYQGKLLLGLTFDDNILHKFNIDCADTPLFYFTIPKEINLAGNISCVLVHIIKENHEPIIWGSTMMSKVSKLDALKSMLNTVSPVKKQNFEQEEQVKSVRKPIEIIEQQFLEDEEVESLIDDEFKKIEEDEQQNEIKKQINDFIPYKELFQVKKSIETASNVKKQQENNETYPKREQERDRDQLHTRAWFYDEVKEQIDALFEKYEREEALEEIIPNARFVRVNFEEGAESYIFGIIYDEANEPEYIVYGIPSTSRSKTPQQLEGYYQWLPLDPENPEDDGYFLMYQDARTGEHVKIEII